MSYGWRDLDTDDYEPRPSSHYYACPNCGYRSENNDEFLYNDENPRAITKDEVWRFIAPHYSHDLADLDYQKTDIVVEALGCSEDDLDYVLRSMSTLELQDLFRKIESMRW